MNVNISFIEHTEPLTSDNMYMTLNNWKNTDISFDNIYKLVGNSNIQYSPYTFYTGKKVSENWNNDKQNILIFDIDEGLSIKDAMKIFDKYTYLIATTKSHNKPKKGIVCDRYRILLPAKNVPKGEMYFSLLKVMEQVLPIDKQTNTRTGAFLGNIDSIFHRNTGIVYDCTPAVKEAEYVLLQELKQQSNKTVRKSKVSDNVAISDIKQKLDIEILSDILEDLGFEIIGRRFKLRPDERTASAVMYDYGRIVDYGNGYSDDIFGLLYSMFDMNFADSIPYVQRYLKE